MDAWRRFPAPIALEFRTCQEGAGRFGKKADPALIDETTKVRIELAPGEFVIFDRWLLHGSPANTSDRQRLGLVARIIPPQVRVDLEKMSPRFAELGVQVIRGADGGGRNHIVPAPAEMDRPRSNQGNL